ncbi:peptidylprolyl isomerase [Flavobacterium akiainvivens]|nr:peptidylprolyl isomerase [Flavobacterium akiainvivens]SFQ65385.1 periplasmic chaperone for outer membrane proteins SurA [Flavobacterium akiainvivens]
MKFINKAALVLLLVVFGKPAMAQEIITEPVKQQDSVKPKLPQTGRFKIDGVVSVVGDFVVLESDIDFSLIELQQQGIPTAEITRCQILGKLMEDRMYAHHAIQDSIIVTDAEINAEVASRMDFFVERLGSEKKVVEYFKKRDLETLKADLFDIFKMQQLTERMRKKIVEEVEITPEEVRQFYTKFKPEERPVFGAEMEVAQIVIKPEISDAAKEETRERLRQIKKDVQAGSSFYSKAVLYSEDRGSGSSGGYIPVNRKSKLVKEFKEAAFSTSEGEISEPFETEYGFHIIYVEKVRGQELDVRHILLKPRVSDDAKRKALEKIALIRQRIVSGEISFAEAARNESMEKETRQSGGQLINPYTLDTRFELTKMDPSIYNDVSNLKDNEVSKPIESDDPRYGLSFKLMTVTNRYEEHPADYARDYTKIKDLALQEKQMKEIEKWSASKIKDTYIKVNGEYEACDFAIDWLKKSTR